VILLTKGESLNGMSHAHIVPLYTL
jgi:hypothetical protein